MKMEKPVIGKISLSSILAIGLAIGLGLAATSCATTNGNWSSDLPEKGSAKGGASLLMKR